MKKLEIDYNKIDNKEDVAEFILQSNYIEGERSVQAFYDGMDAWNWAYKHRNNIKKHGINYILDIHWFLAHNIAPDIAGKIRSCDVWIGGKRKKFISEFKIVEDLEKILNMMQSKYPELDKEKEEFAKHCHVEFENVHPFVDFNGRTGRILYNIQRINLGLDLHIIHEGGEQLEYYKWFK